VPASGWSSGCLRLTQREEVRGFTSKPRWNDCTSFIRVSGLIRDLHAFDYEICDEPANFQTLPGIGILSEKTAVPLRGV
jgi:hypothetical protein